VIPFPTLQVGRALTRRAEEEMARRERSALGARILKECSTASKIQINYVLEFVKDRIWGHNSCGRVV
jgi:hypothetical protein